MKKQSLPNGMGSVLESIKSDKDFMEFLKNTSNPYLIRGFSINNVISVEQEIKVINRYIKWWKEEYYPKNLGELEKQILNPSLTFFPRYQSYSFFDEYNHMLF